MDRTEALAPDLVSRYFDESATFETPYGNGGFSPAAPNVIGTAVFSDETALEAAISGGMLPPNTRAVVYDDEDWSFTPPAQQRDPATYYQRAAQAAHAAGLLFLAAPAINLANVVNPGSLPTWQRYLAAGIASETARYADIYEVQAQTLEAQPTTYASFVHQAAQQAYAENPSVRVMGVLSTNPKGVAESSPVLLAAAKASQSDVWGWGINDPGLSPECFDCSGPYPQTVVGFLQGLSPQSVPQSPTVTATPMTPTTTTTTPPPTITGLAQSHRRWREGRGRARIAPAKPPIGTAFRFTLNENASLRFAFAQLVPGREEKGRCAAQTAANRNRRACKRRAPRGSLSFSAGAGTHKVIFRGHLARSRELKPGTYTVTVTATNAAGQRAAGTLTFTIVPG